MYNQPVLLEFKNNKAKKKLWKLLFMAKVPLTTKSKTSF